MSVLNGSLITPGATIGILGGGQLGRMLAMAAAQLGLKSHIYAPEADSPAFDVATRHTLGAYDDVPALQAFAAQVDCITYEFENIPSETVAALEHLRPVYPDRVALTTSQDRLSEKTFLNVLGIATAPFVDVEDAGALARAVAQIGRPAILKTRRFGYDGKGQAVVRESADLAAVYRSLGGLPCILEGIVRFTHEVSVIAARSNNGQFAAYDVCENAHSQHILSKTTVPAQISEGTAKHALEITERIARALNYVGVFAVEMFVTEDAKGFESLIVNEMAPRVHNSGHWTLDGAVTSQFEQHIRAICGWPLGSTRRHGRIEMQNLIGSEADNWHEILAEGHASLRLYGKRESRPGRKMGHVTRVFAEN